MPVSVRPFRRSDRDQLSALVNRHIAAVLPGVALSTNAVMNQLEREPNEVILDPWVAERSCIVAIDHHAVVAAALLLRYSDEERVREGYRNAAEIRWVVAEPGAHGAADCLMTEVIAQAAAWGATALHAESALPAPGCLGVPDTWPHVRQILLDAGFSGPDRTEHVLAAECADLVGHCPASYDVLRSVGALGVRIDLAASGEPLGYIEVGEMNPALSRSISAATWTDVGNLFPSEGTILTEVMPALVSAAAEWLLLGGIDRLIDYYAPDVHPPEYLAVLQQLGFTRLATNERGWTMQPG
ncbi:MAG: N-acetyltransferase [Actinomycetota bacterium]